MTGKTSPKLATRTSWAAANDRGPHIAVLPSGLKTGEAVKFKVADTGALLRSGKLPEHLRVIGQLAVAHADGIEGYFADLVQVALMRGGDAQATIAAAIQNGVELGHHLIAEMLVQPQVTAEMVAEGIFPELDIRMLLEFAERKRNVDAAGNQLPIVVLDPDEWTRFRTRGDDAERSADRGANGSESAGADRDDDRGGV
jgi:hypothetical protein